MCIIITISLISLLEPSLSPSDVNATNKSSTAIDVEWSPISKRFIPGILLGYHIHYTNLDPEGFGDVSKGVRPTGVGSTSTQIEGLLKFTNYSIKVSGFTVKGDGPMSDAVIVTTDEDGEKKYILNVSELDLKKKLKHNIYQKLIKVILAENLRPSSVWRKPKKAEDF